MFFVLKTVKIILAWIYSSLCSVGTLAMSMASEYEIPGYIVLKALFWTVSMLSDSYTGKLVCHTGQAYSTTRRITDK